VSFSNPVVGGENGELVRRSIQSPDYVPGVSGWSINRDGSAEFNNVTIRLDLTTGSIVVGPDTGPQVVIRTTTAGLIEFPTNESYESTGNAANILSFGHDSTESVQLSITSGVVIDPNWFTFSYLDLWSGEGNNNSANTRAILGVSGTTSSADITVYEDQVVINAPDTYTDGELWVAQGNASGNAPSRVVAGEVGTGATNTTIPLTTDTEITNTSRASVYLENGAAYEVDIQIQAQKTSGTSVAGTHSIDFKLWDGAVGVNQLGPTIREVIDTANNSLLDTYRFSFVFRFTGSTGLKTLRLSGAKPAGGDTIQAQYNPVYHMLVKRAGDPALITNL